ncbi:unnamed protein product [Parascedosporium putredinis]|uniref:Uncharacterized protein n=1 Tax=Parascedosporium putredinis TaxID=1442378 RepID=A0A9P1H029_9PEZI|nr:unnamed protein product [Parascedosporium putredinis]CAI7991691.1 unnamed protein product [Parascedosporium putredinis]
MKFTSTFALLGMLQAVLAQSLAPSPTESIGCEPHGDHWYALRGRPPYRSRRALYPAPAPTVSTPVEEDHDHEDEEDHDHEGGESASLSPSPTESIGCEPHGDHWHCEGPRVTDGAEQPTSTDDDAASETTPIVQVPTGAAAGLQIGSFVPVVAVAIFAQAAF